MKHEKVLTYCSLATYNGLKVSFFSLQFNNSNSGLFTVYTGMKNISRVHMVDSWNGLKKVSVSRQTSNMGTVPDLKPDKRKAVTVVLLGRRFESKLLWDLNCHNFDLMSKQLQNCQKAARWQEACHQVLSSSILKDFQYRYLKFLWKEWQR